MAVVTSDLKIPSGELRGEWFPNGTLDTYIAQWLIDVEQYVDEITDAVTRDAASIAWIYWKAYGDIASRMAATPEAEEYYREIQRQYGGHQLSYFRQKSTENYDKFRRLTTTNDPASSSRFSIPLRNKAVW